MIILLLEITTGKGLQLAQCTSLHVHITMESRTKRTSVELTMRRLATRRRYSPECHSVSAIRLIKSDEKPRGFFRKRSPEPALESENVTLERHAASSPRKTLGVRGIYLFFFFHRQFFVDELIIRLGMARVIGKQHARNNWRNVSKVAPTRFTRM